MPEQSKPLVIAWGWLAGLSLLAALIAQAPGFGLPRTVAGVAILALALAKARVILARYLGLAQAPSWLRGFMWVVGLWALLILGLYLIPALTA